MQSWVKRENRLLALCPVGRDVLGGTMKIISVESIPLEIDGKMQKAAQCCDAAWDRSGKKSYCKLTCFYPYMASLAARLVKPGNPSSRPKLQDNWDLLMSNFSLGLIFFIKIPFFLCGNIKTCQ